MTSVVFGSIGLPPDIVAVGAAFAAVLLFLTRRRSERWLTHLVDKKAALTTRSLAIIAALGSVGYYYFYLRGGPRIIDAAYYWLQAKTFASGHITVPLFHPTAALRGRFLYFDAAHGRLSVLFPPGYAALLALGMLVKSPQIVGPCIAAGLVLVTAALARRVFEHPRVAVTAALLSAVCIALRYHTADTMSHGWAAMLFTTALFCAFGSTWKDYGLAGFCTGWLVATRPVTALALLIILCLVMRRKSAKPRLTLLVGMLPGILGWLLYQRVSTGSWFESTQFAYYAVSDGPPGCFRYGFGSNIGCQFEHGGYVAKRLPHGYTALSALVVSGVRLRWHLLDILNFEPLALLLLLVVRDSWRHARARPLLLSPVVLLLAYAPFYFDGNFPGGGARLLADIIPIEHVLLASWIAIGGRLVPTLAVAMFGFSVHGAFEHLRLQNREGGRPMFEASVVSDAGVRHGLILVGTDHGFALGHQPGSVDAQHGTVVAREHGDAHDRLLWDRLGRPPIYRYNFPFTREQGNPNLQALTFDANKVWRFEAEAEWPVLAVRNAWAVPGFPPNGCVSARRALIIHPTAPAPGVDIALPVPRTGRYRVGLGWVSYDNEPMTIGVRLGLGEWRVRTVQSRFECGTANGPPIQLSEGEHPIRFEFERQIALDWVELNLAD
jgi:hypothetical protein